MNQSPIRLTQHARDVLEERRIPIDWITRVIEAPVLLGEDSEDKQLIHALAPIAEREGRVLRVVYNRRADSISVITAYFDRSMRGKL
jgi:hypothetical protein